MPNGFFHRDELDVLTLAYTEQGYPEFRVRQTHEGIRIIHVRGVRGYAPLVDWAQYSEPAHEGRTFSRASVEALATSYVASLAKALDQPGDALAREVRRASLAWLAFEGGWAIAIGDYYVYGRTDGELGHISADRRFAELPPEVARIFLRDEITPDGLHTGDLANCVFEIAGCREVLCTTVQLHVEPEWPRIAALPLDDEAAGGMLVTCMRRHALRSTQDAIAVRWRRPTRAG